MGARQVAPTKQAPVPRIGHASSYCHVNGPCRRRSEDRLDSSPKTRLRPFGRVWNHEPHAGEPNGLSPARSKPPSAPSALTRRSCDRRHALFGGFLSCRQHTRARRFGLSENRCPPAHLLTKLASRPSAPPSGSQQISFLSRSRFPSTPHTPARCVPLASRSTKHPRSISKGRSVTPLLRASISDCSYPSRDTAPAFSRNFRPGPHL